MAQERFEWLEIPDAPQAPRAAATKLPEPLLGKRCPQCGWLDDETAIQCFRCGYRYNVDHGMAERIYLHGKLDEEAADPDPSILEKLIERVQKRRESAEAEAE